MPMCRRPFVGTTTWPPTRRSSARLRLARATDGARTRGAGMVPPLPDRGPLRLYVLPVDLSPGKRPAYPVDALRADTRDAAALAGRTSGELRRLCGEVLRSVAVEGAELAVLPPRWHHVAGTPARVAQARDAIAAAAAEGLATLVLVNDDSSEPLELPEAH